MLYLENCCYLSYMLSKYFLESFILIALCIPTSCVLALFLRFKFCKYIFREIKKCT